MNNWLLAIELKERVQLWSAAAALVVLYLLIFLIRKGKLKTSYSLLWFVGWFVCSFFILFPNLLDALSNRLGIHYSPTFLLLMMVTCLGLTLMHFSIVITRQSKQINALAQEVALMKSDNETKKVSCED